jgi:hypothetical protein
VVAAAECRVLRQALAVLAAPVAAVKVLLVWVVLELLVKVMPVALAYQTMQAAAAVVLMLLVVQVLEQLAALAGLEKHLQRLAEHMRVAAAAGVRLPVAQQVLAAAALELIFAKIM